MLMERHSGDSETYLGTLHETETLQERERFVHYANTLHSVHASLTLQIGEATQLSLHQEAIHAGENLLMLSPIPGILFTNVGYFQVYPREVLVKYIFKQ